MREIKFRGQTNSGSWVYGSLIYHNEQPRIEFVKKRHPVDGRVLATDWAYVVPESVGQFIGVTDKKGNEIYEGDILESVKNKYLVLWNQDTASFFKKILPIKGVECYSFVSKELEGKKQIIGNIYENPELLYN